MSELEYYTFIETPVFTRQIDSKASLDVLYATAERQLIGERHNIFSGTSIGFTEAPHLYKSKGYYYLIAAEGGRNSSTRAYCRTRLARQLPQISHGQLSGCAVRTMLAQGTRRISTTLSIASVNSPPRLIAVDCKPIGSIVFKRGQDDHYEILSCSGVGINDRGRASCGTGEN